MRLGADRLDVMHLEESKEGGGPLLRTFLQDIEASKIPACFLELSMRITKAIIFK